MTTNTSDRTLLFMMTMEQAETYGRLLGAAERGDGSAACQLGDMYREGLGGLRYSPKEARRWYAKSALTGDAGGQSNLGACYEHGLGCAQSYVKAVKWYRLAAAQQLGTASMNLGYCYLNGHGVSADRSEALRLFRLAVAQGEYRAEDELERLGESVSGEKVTTRPQIRLVNGTEAGEHFGVVGAGGPTPLDEEDSALEKIRLELLAVLTAGNEDAEDRESAAPLRRWPEYSEAARKAVLKDDCFGVPEPGDSGYETFMADMRHFWRSHAAGTIPHYKGEPTIVWTPALEASFFDLYSSEGITPEEVASERRERYRAYLARTDPETEQQ